MEDLRLWSFWKKFCGTKHGAAKSFPACFRLSSLSIKGQDYQDYQKGDEHEIAAAKKKTIVILVCKKIYQYVLHNPFWNLAKKLSKRIEKDEKTVKYMSHLN